MLFKGCARAFAFRRHIAGRLLGISFMTLAELERVWGLLRKAETGTPLGALHRAARRSGIMPRMGRNFFQRKETRKTNSGR